jgi:hypothetical protein
LEWLQPISIARRSKTQPALAIVLPDTPRDTAIAGRRSAIELCEEEALPAQDLMGRVRRARCSFCSGSCGCCRLGRHEVFSACADTCRRPAHRGRRRRRNAAVAGTQPRLGILVTPFDLHDVPQRRDAHNQRRGSRFGCSDRWSSTASVLPIVTSSFRRSPPSTTTFTSFAGEEEGCDPLASTPRQRLRWRRL